MSVGKGKFKMCTPIKSIYGHIICGAIVGDDKTVTYTRRISPYAKRDDIRKACQEIREQVHRDHPGIKEEFTMLRPQTAFN